MMGIYLLIETRLTDISFMQVGRRHGGSHSFIGPVKAEEVFTLPFQVKRRREEDRLFCH